MKTIHVTFTDQEFKRLVKAKILHEKTARVGWHSFILAKCCAGVRVKP